MNATTPAAERPRFWSDDFDMDLLKVFPGIETKLRNPAAVLWTVGHESYGRLNHPATWNGPYGALLWLQKPNLQRDKHGWFNVDGLVSDDAEIEWTWLEYLRDAWSHHYSAIILPHRAGLPAMEWFPFQEIMYDLRGWRKVENLEEHRQRALRWIFRCDFILHAVGGDMGRL